MSTVFILFQPQHTLTVMNIPDKNHKTVQNTLNLPPMLVFDYLVHPQRILTSSKFFSQTMKQKSFQISVLRVKGSNFSLVGTRSKAMRRSETRLKPTPPPTPAQRN